MSETKATLNYETVPDRHSKTEWRVEAIDYDHDGAILVAVFSGPDAKRRAEEYAAWKNGRVH